MKPYDSSNHTSNPYRSFQARNRKILVPLIDPFMQRIASELERAKTRQVLARFSSEAIRTFRLGSRGPARVRVSGFGFWALKTLNAAMAKDAP